MRQKQAKPVTSPLQTEREVRGLFMFDQDYFHPINRIFSPYFQDLLAVVEAHLTGSGSNEVKIFPMDQ